MSVWKPGVRGLAPLRNLPQPPSAAPQKAERKGSRYQFGMLWCSRQCQRGYGEREREREGGESERERGERERETETEKRDREKRERETERERERERARETSEYPCSADLCIRVHLKPHLLATTLVTPATPGFNVILHGSAYDSTEAVHATPYLFS